MTAAWKSDAQTLFIEKKKEYEQRQSLERYWKGQIQKAQEEKEANAKRHEDDPQEIGRAHV